MSKIHPITAPLIPRPPHPYDHNHNYTTYLWRSIGSVVESSPIGPSVGSVLLCTIYSSNPKQCLAITCMHSKRHSFHTNRPHSLQIFNKNIIKTIILYPQLNKSLLWPTSVCYNQFIILRKRKNVPLQYFVSANMYPGQYCNM